MLYILRPLSKNMGNMHSYLTNQIAYFLHANDEMFIHQRLRNY